MQADSLTTSLGCLSGGKRLGTQGHQSVTELNWREKQPAAPTFTLTAKLESQFNPTCWSMECGRKPEHADMGKTCTEVLVIGFEPRTFLL